MMSRHALKQKDKRMQAQGKKVWTICTSALLIGSLTGCATKQWVREQVAVLDQRVTATEHRIEEVDAKANEALARFNNLHLERQFVLNMKGGAEFDSGSSALSEEGQKAVSGFLSDLDNTEGLVFLVAGHTDSVGAEERNYELGQRRAASVARHLIKQGIDPFRITTVSYGEESPVADNQTKEGKRQNRRIEIRVYREGILATPHEPSPQANVQGSAY
jgi:outer membrane protein OmpA-like peptidoglycan-associated protein